MTEDLDEPPDATREPGAMATTSPPTPAGERVQSLSVREGRRPVLEPVEGVPDYLEGPLRAWLRAYLHFGTGNLKDRIALNLAVVMPRSDGQTKVHVDEQPGVELLDVVDLALRLDKGLASLLKVARNRWGDQNSPLQRANAVFGLAQMLEDANSVYRVDDTGEVVRLVRRVDPIAQAAAEQAITEAEPTAGELLDRAWSAAYARTPTPPAAYRDAVLAVERVACQVVLPDDIEATLGKVINHLRDAPTKWELELADDRGGRAVDTLRGMFALLWRGEKRHASGDYRDVTLDETHAAVQLAVTCVQWLTDGVLRRRTTDTGSTS